MKRVVVAVLGAIATGCGGAHAPAEAAARMWTETQAESIAGVRGLPVHVRRCEGLGPGRTMGEATVYRRFSCLAGARLAHQPIDTVAITYVLRPLGPYRGASSLYVLTNVRFGGLGVP